MSPLSGDCGPFGRVKRCFHPNGGNVPWIGRSFNIKRVCWHSEASKSRYDSEREVQWISAISPSYWSAFCSATYHANLKLDCGPWVGVGCCIPVRKGVWRSKETRGGFSFTRSPRMSAGPNCTLGRKDLGRIFRQSKRRFVMRASSERFGRRYSHATSFLSSIWDATAGYRYGAPLAFPRYTAARIVRFRCRRASWKRSSRTPMRPIWHSLPAV